MGKRIEYIDFIKGICIFIVVWEEVHIFRKQPENMNRLFQNNKWLNLSYIIFIENFKIMKNSVLPLNRRIQFLIREMAVLYQRI